MQTTCISPPNQIDFKIDFKKEYTKSTVVQQFDTVLLNIDLLENSKVLDLTDKIIEIDYLNANNTQTEIRQDNIIINNSNVKILCPPNCTISAGIARFQLRVFCMHNAEMSSYPVEIEIRESIISSPAESENIIALIDGGTFYSKNYNEYDGGTFI